MILNHEELIDRLTIACVREVMQQTALWASLSQPMRDALAQDIRRAIVNVLHDAEVDPHTVVSTLGDEGNDQAT
jgi:hypothetical protein